ncbi:hypothetical protein LV82_02629 [Albidovulum inexpectatum]|uniref:Uncharacterized protein n=1 Tax=Albidovulum inexpectatum TaxID=196587 RepID=A0A2S5JE86_9RHOB|nr:hypothetical protein LV82_02629 [Albidovulum inexpectatum]
MVEPANPELSIGKQCKLLSISRSSFYYQPKGETALNLMLMRQIDEQFLETPFFGVRQMTWHLRNEYPSCASAICDPEAICLDECVCGFDQLAHEGHKGDLGGFSGSAERGVFGPEIRVEAHGDESGHVERVA